MNEEIARKIYAEVTELLKKFSVKEVAEKLSDKWEKSKLCSDTHMRLKSTCYAYGRLVLGESNGRRYAFISYKPNTYTSF